MIGGIWRLHEAHDYIRVMYYEAICFGLLLVLALHIQEYRKLREWNKEQVEDLPLRDDYDPDSRTERWRRDYERASKPKMLDYKSQRRYNLQDEFDALQRIIKDEQDDPTIPR